MRSLIVAVASALLLAVVVTEFTQRLWPSSYLALLIITTIALLVNGIFNQRVAGKPAAAAPSQGQRNDSRNDSRNNDRNRDRNKNRDNNRNQERGNNRNRNNEGRPKQSSSERGEPKPKAAAAPAKVPSGPREKGEVKWFNRSKGFGFIIRESGDEIFVHQRSIRGADDSRSRPVLRDGEAVEFVVTEHDKGLQAEDVVATDRS